jgi:hypothetical protein
VSLREGEAARDEGVALVSENNPTFVEIMREAARVLARKNGSVCSDDLRAYAQMCGIEPEHQNAWGAIFRGQEWVVVGRRKSRLTSNHAREIRVWTLRELVSEERLV